jgi:hypothetical protein
MKLTHSCLGLIMGSGFETIKKHLNQPFIAILIRNET